MHATYRHLQRGQTLIETVVAVFILVLGISTAIGLGVYAFNNADDSTRVIVGTSLAREGVEAVKNQRDSNWIADSPNGPDNNTQNCTFDGGSVQQPCDESWLNNLSSGTYALDFDGGNNNDAGQTLTVNPSSYALKYCPSTKAYLSSSSGAPYCAGAQSTIYSRKIVLQSSTSYGGTNYYYTDAATGNTYPAFLSAVVTVWWTSRHCPVANDPSTLPNSCKTTLEMHLTTWQKTFN
jgi:type II secretory pathway pseudopilin PulG